MLLTGKFSTEWKQFIWVSMYLSQKYLYYWGHYFHVSYWRRDLHFMLSSEPLKGLAACREKVVPSFLSYFKTLSIGPVPWIEPMTSCCTDKCSTDRANPAAVKKSKNIVKKIIKYCQKAVAVVMHALCPFERKWSLSLIMINFVSHFREVSWNFSDVIVFISVWVTKLSQKVNQLLKIRVMPLFFIVCVGLL